MREGGFWYTETMAKPKKKRTKKYSGIDAATHRSSVTRVSAVNRSRLGQWLHDRQRMLKLAGTVLIIIAVIILVISGIISLF